MFDDGLQSKEIFYEYTRCPISPDIQLLHQVRFNDIFFNLSPSTNNAHETPVHNIVNYTYPSCLGQNKNHALGRPAQQGPYSI